VALKQWDAEEFLELLDLVADGGRRDAEFLGALGEAAMTRGCFKRQQRLERGQARAIQAAARGGR
jgi:hypothetical protein